MSTITTEKKSLFESNRFYYFLVFFLIYAGSNTIITQVVISTQISIILIASVLLFLFLAKFRINATRSSLKILTALILMMFISLVLNADSENFFGVFIIAIKILSGFLLFSCFDRVRILKAFCRIMVFFAIASLIVTYLFPIFSLEQFFPVVTNSTGVRFFNCIFSLKIDSYGYFASRNYGIFSEPAVYCYYLLIAAISDIFFFEDSVWKYLSVVILCITMITTLSPMGIVCAFPLLILAFVDMHRTKEVSLMKKSGLLLLLIIVVVLLLSNEAVRRGLTFAFQKSDLTSGSGEGRMRAIWLDFAYWVRRPLFGGSLQRLTKITATIGHNTSTTGAMFVSFGMFFAGTVTYLQYKSVKFFTEKRGLFITLLVFVLYILTINNHGLLPCDWYWYFAFIGICGANNNESTDTDLQPEMPRQKETVDLIK